MTIGLSPFLLADALGFRLRFGTRVIAAVHSLVALLGAAACYLRLLQYGVDWKALRERGRGKNLSADQKRFENICLAEVYFTLTMAIIFGIMLVLDVVLWLGLYVKFSWFLLPFVLFQLAVSILIPLAGILVLETSLVGINSILVLVICNLYCAFAVFSYFCRLNRILSRRRRRR